MERVPQPLFLDSFRTMIMKNRLDVRRQKLVRELNRVNQEIVITKKEMTQLKGQILQLRRRSAKAA